MRRVIYVLIGTLGFASVARANDVNSQIQALEERIQNRAPDLQRERDRNGRIKKELVGSVGGCWSEQRIQKLEILVNGAHLPNGNGIPSQSPMQSVGNAGEIRFVLSETVQYTIANEEQMQVIAPNGRIVSQDFGMNLIRDITMVKVVKGGKAYTSSAVDEFHSGFIGIGAHTERSYLNYETNRYSIGGITIKVNDQILYQKSGIGFTLEGNNLEWKDMNLGLNEAWIRLMNRQDCPTTN